MFSSYLRHYLNIKFYKKNHVLLLNIIVLILLLVFPYYLFGGKLFLGGDDSRIFYAYPKEFLTNTQFFSWSNLSSIGWNYPNQDFIPFVTLWSLLSFVIKSPMILTYLAFSLPFILGFVFFQKMLSVLVLEQSEKYKFTIFLGSLFYIFSPILINNHFLNPLIPIWLVGLIPATIYYFVNFVKDGKYFNIFKAVLLIVTFSFGLHNIPWILAFLFPLILSLLICSILFKKRDILVFIKRGLVFLILIFLSSSFWILPFIASFAGESAGSVISKVVSSDFTDAFASTVQATARGVLIHPLLNLFHRQIAFDFDWNLKNIYLSFYDKTLYLNFIYIMVFFLGLFSIKKEKNKLERKIFIILLFAFVFILYLFTVNIGPLFDFYILLGKVPGFILFRNAYDKFALGYALIFSAIITFCLIFIKQKYKDKSKITKWVYALFIVVTLINLIPLKSTIVSPLWTTKNIYKNITIPNEYLNFLKNVKIKISPTNNILSIPYGLSLYTFIKDTSSNNVYAGISPVVIFSGVNDISGYLSFNYLPDADKINKLIIERKYDEFNKILYSHNINYVLITKNVPRQVKDSYLFIPEVLKAQDKIFIQNITGKKLLTSSHGNYELYTTKNKNLLISSHETTYKRINRVRYEITFNKLKSKQDLLFNDSYHPGWKLYLAPYHEISCETKAYTEITSTTECISNQKLEPLEDIELQSLTKVFDNSHTTNLSNNKWTIDPKFIKKHFDKSFYKENADGSINVKLVLYFAPQIYFYIGTFISLFTIIFIAAYTLKQNEKNNK